VTLDYSDDNGNFIEQLADSAQTSVTAPIMTLSKEAGEVTILEYVLANFTIRVAGEKWHDVRLTLFYDGVGTDVASVTRFPGDPDDQSVTIYDIKIGIIPGTFSAAITYTPFDDDINGQWWGADPCWLTIAFPDGYSKRLHHTFNVRHNDTWIWTIDDFSPYIAGQPIIKEATVPYLIAYENIGTGDASNVVITDILPVDVTLEESDPPYDTVVGNIYSWIIGTVLSMEGGQISIVVIYVFEDNGTILTNEVTLIYSDANGNYIEQLYDAVDIVLVTFASGKIMPEIPQGDEPEDGDGGMELPIGIHFEFLRPGTPSLGTNLIYSPSILAPQSGLPEPVEDEKVGDSAEMPGTEVDGAAPVEADLTWGMSEINFMGSSISLDKTIMEKTASSQPIHDSLSEYKVENVEQVPTIELNMDDIECLHEIVMVTHSTVKDTSGSENVMHQGHLDQGFITTDLKAQETALVPSSGAVSVSLVALLFILSALAVGAYTHRRLQIKKRG
jgi:hypothetical protein